LAVLQYALAGWPESDMAAAQQRFRAARAAAVAAAAHAQVRAARTSSASAAAAKAFALMGAAAAVAAAAVASQSRNASDSVMPWSSNTAAPGATAAAAAIATTAASDVLASGENPKTQTVTGNVSRVEVDLDNEDNLDLEERVMAEAAAAALEADAAAVTAADAAVGIIVPPPASQVPNLDLHDVIVLELDHDWFHLRESYYDAVRRQNKWDPNVRQVIGTAMSYTELPWEAQLDMVWHTLAAAGVELPIRVFA
ncbi:hypothetical protein Vafri_16148, partial [Volvox africanus]